MTIMEYVIFLKIMDIIYLTYILDIFNIGNTYKQMNTL